MMKEKLLEKFQDVYGDINGTKVYFAPGRVNLMVSTLITVADWCCRVH